MKNFKDIPALKAVSQNLMHANLSITDGIYAILSDLDVKEQISLLGKTFEGSSNKADLIVQLRQLLGSLEKSAG